MSKKSKAMKKHADRSSNNRGIIKSFFYDNAFVLWSFLITFVLMSISYAILNVTPFGIFGYIADVLAGKDVTAKIGVESGDKQILVVDLWHQYFPFLVDLQDKLQHGQSLFYTWSVGMGTNYLALMSYYFAGPINFLCVFVPQEYLRQFLAISVCVRMGLASAFFAMFLRYTFKRNDFSITIFSILFGLCSFFMGYYWNVIWLDSVAITPLVIMGMIALLREGKFKLYIISLAVGIMANYYIGLFLCYFTLLCFIAYSICKWAGFKNLFRNIGKMGVSTIISLCLTAILTIPAFMGLQMTTSTTTNKMPTEYAINFGGSNDLMGTLNAFGRIISNLIAYVKPAASKADALPNIYCGVIALVFAVIFLASNKVKIREKLVSLGLLIFFILSFIIRQLDYIWHGFHFTNMIPYRFSFLFSFVLIFMAYRAFTLIKSITFWDALIAGLFTAIIIVIALGKQEQVSIIVTAIIAILIIATVALYTKKVIPKNAMTAILAVVVIAEMGLNTYLGAQTVSVTGTYDYPRTATASSNPTKSVLEKMYQMEENTIDRWRAETTTTQTLNDGALNQYPGVSMFSSMANYSVSRFVEDFGFASWPTANRYTYLESSPFTNTMMNIKYLISRDGKYRNESYLQNVASEGSVTLLKNTQYLPMGFVTSTNLLNYEVWEQSTPRNPFDVQNDFFKKATGLNKDLYTPLQVVSQGHSDGKVFKAHKTEYGKYMLKKTAAYEQSEEFKKTQKGPHVKFNYTAPEDGYFCGYITNWTIKDMTLKCNDVDVQTYSVSKPYIMSLGNFKKGDKISLYCEMEPDENSKMGNDAQYPITVYCNMLNQDVFEEGVKILGQSTLNAHEVTDTKIKGDIDVKEDGLFYTSIPYEKGWSAKVDGEEVEITPVGKALVAFKIGAGKHTVELNFIPGGFIPGLIITVIGLFMLILLIVFNKKLKEKFGEFFKEPELIAIAAGNSAENEQERIDAGSDNHQGIKQKKISTDDLLDAQIKTDEQTDINQYDYELNDEDNIEE